MAKINESMFPVSWTLYTSLGTSVALRDAGAPQDGVLAMYWCDGLASPAFYNGTAQTLHYARAFRADEIIVALGDRLDAIDRYGMPGATYRIALSGERGSHVADSLVEALAQAWIVVLKEEKR